MATRTESVAAVQERATGRLGGQTAQRDNQRVAQAVHDGEELDAVRELSEAGLLDEFFAYLETLGVPALVPSLAFANVERVLIPLGQFVTLYPSAPPSEAVRGQRFGVRAGFFHTRRLAASSAGLVCSGSSG